MKKLYAVRHKPSGNILRRGIGRLQVHEEEEKAQCFIEGMRYDGVDVDKDYDIIAFYEDDTYKYQPNFEAYPSPDKLA